MIAGLYLGEVRGNFHFWLAVGFMRSLILQVFRLIMIEVC